eukprot:COSAG05_NODE_11878_length_492_cov_0.692112_1_plen_74_part_10
MSSSFSGETGRWPLILLSGRPPLCDARGSAFIYISVTNRAPGAYSLTALTLPTVDLIIVLAPLRINPTTMLTHS